MEKGKLNTEALINEYISLATIEGEAKLNGDYKTGNSMVKKLNRIYEAIKGDMDVAQNVLGSVMKSNSTRARSLSAVDALRLNICVKEAIDVLEDEAKRDDILGFGCEMALKLWRGEIPGKTL